MKRTRLFQITVLLLVVVAAVQVGYWLYDQHVRGVEKTAALTRLYDQQAAAARALLDGGAPLQRVQETFPDLAVNAQKVELAPEHRAALLAEQQHRLTQYQWEGGFFLFALCACIGVIFAALRAETRVLNEQEQFLALVSHQFKTPLASLQLSVETMNLRQLPPERSRALLERMLSDLTRMETMVGQILDSSRLSHGRWDLKREPVLLDATVNRVVSQYLERAQTDHIAIESQVPADLRVLADPIAVDVVVRNILENALAAVAPVGGGTVTLAARAQGEEVELAVRDSGIGFRPDDQPQLFRKFSRLNAGAGSSYYGTGLGLYIVQRLMQLTGGRVSASSEGLGRGAEFRLTWPMAGTQAESHA
ncbi:MAG TPA: HAMP domain-containing sensor histidine kinase [Steroidobacteraceae bacterium]|nr:HAMP domain-containing sensor histidine kinase [Steroidobacteraceae bacterium]